MTIDTSAPLIATAVATNDQLTITFTEVGSGLLANSPSTTDFTVTFDNRADGVNSFNVTAVTIDAINNRVTLTLDSTLLLSDTGIILNYSSSGDSQSIRDGAENQAVAFSHVVSNHSGDSFASAAPTLSLDISSDSGVQGDGKTNDFSPTIRASLNGSGIYAPVSGDVFQLFEGNNQVGSSFLTDLDIANGYTLVSLSTYATGGMKTYTGKILDQSGNLSAASVALSVTMDNVSPVLLTAKVDSAYLTLKYVWSGVGFLSGTPTPAEYNVTVNGINRSVESVYFDTSTGEVTLTLSSAVMHGDTVVLNYNGNGGQFIRNLIGNVASNLVSQPVGVNNLAWQNYNAYQVALNYDGTNTSPNPQTLISVVELNQLDHVDTAGIISSVEVLTTDIANAGLSHYIDKPSTTDPSVTLATNWDPIKFTVKPLDTSGHLVDASSVRDGTQIRVLIDITNSELSSGVFNAYMKYISADTIQNYLHAHIALVTLDGVVLNNISQAGWYDYTQRAASGNGARFIVSGGKIVSVEITITDNQFGDDDPTTDHVLDPGVPVLVTKLSSATDDHLRWVADNVLHNSSYINFDLIVDRLDLERDHYQPLLFIDPNKNYASAFIYEVLLDDQHLNYLDVIVENSSKNQHAISYEDIHKFHWDSKFKVNTDLIQGDGFTALGQISALQIISVDSYYAEAFPSWIRVDSNGYVFVSNTLNTGDDFDLRVAVKDSLGRERVLQVKVGAKGIQSVADNTKHKSNMGVMGHENRRDFSISALSNVAFGGAIIGEHQGLKYSKERQNKSSFSKQIKFAKDELYNLNLIS